MSSPLISVTLPTYNPLEAHFRAAIESVLAQTFADFEVLVIDDCSTSGHAEEIVASYNDPRIRFFRNETNLGIAGTRNKMLELARGTYIAVMDHDDLCLPTRFEKQLQVMQANPDIGICGTAHRRFGRLFKNDVIRYPAGDAEIRAGLFFKCVVHHPSVMIRKQVLDQYAIRYDESLISVNDRALYKAVGEHARLCNLDEVLCLYRLHAGMTSRKKKAQINEEQKRMRDDYLRSIGVSLSAEQRAVLNDYVLKGRARIAEAATLEAVEAVLALISEANAASRYLPVQVFDRLCATYLLKRCMNAMVYGRVASGALLKRTRLPVGEAGVPFLLRVFNALMKG